VQQLVRGKVVSAGSEAKDLSLAELWLVIRKRRVFLVSMALGFAMLAALAGVVRGKRYSATGEVQIQPGSASELKQSISAMLTSGMGSLDIIVESDIRILESDKLLTAVAEKLKLQDNLTFLRGAKTIKTSAFGGASIPLLHGDMNNYYVRAAILRGLRGNLTVERVPRTEMISIRYRSPSPELSADIVNALESEFVENNFVSHYNTTK
jgi:uncharacterized protein involved in exopolysaccharide biosynthesis